MDYLIENGDYVLSPAGYLETVSDIDEIKQQINFLLVMPKGSFIYDMELGSELRSLYKYKRNRVKKAVDALVRDALSVLENITVENVICEWINTDKINISVEFKANGILSTTEVVI